MWHAWRPDGSIVYATGNPNTIWVTEESGSRRLSDFDRSKCLPALSTDGRTVAFSTGRSVGLVDVDSGKLTKVPAGGEPLSLAWRPKPIELAYSVGNAIHLVTHDGNNQRLLRHVRGYRAQFEDPFDGPVEWQPCRRVENLRWSADGRVLAYLAWPRPRLVLLDVGSNRLLTYVDGPIAFAISPDGRHSATYTDDLGCDPAAEIDGHLVGGGGTPHSWGNVAWSPDGRFVAWELSEVDMGHDSPNPPTYRSLILYNTTAAKSLGRMQDDFPEFEWSPDGRAFVYVQHTVEGEEESETKPRFVSGELTLVKVSDVLRIKPISRVDHPLAYWEMCVENYLHVEHNVGLSGSRFPYWNVSTQSIRRTVLVPRFRSTDLAWSSDGKRVSWISGRQILAVSVPPPAR
jgi:dipeptidyl aminopeptidase/acylaminoacyl peptidase